MNKLKLRILLSTVLCLAGILVALGADSTQPVESSCRIRAGIAAVTTNAPRAPDVVRLVGPVVSTLGCETCLRTHQPHRFRRNGSLGIRTLR
jgi:hypothetical protein